MGDVFWENDPEQQSHAPSFTTDLHEFCRECQSIARYSVSSIIDQLFYLAVITVHLEFKFRFETNVTRVITDNGSAAGTMKQMLVLDELPHALVNRYGIVENLYVRECYIDLYDIVVEKMIKYENKRPGMLFTGVPGIGKSMFLIYFMCRYLTDDRFPDKRFVFQIGLQEYSIFDSLSVSMANGPTLVKYVSYETLPSNFSIGDALLLVDMVPLESPSKRGKWTLIFSSPNPMRYKEFMKVQPSTTFYLPTWSEAELLCVNPDKMSWYSRFVMCGGIPRMVLRSNTENDLLNVLVSDIRCNGIHVAEEFLKTDHGDIALHNTCSLVHINPPKVNGKYVYQCEFDELVYSFASDYVVRRINSTITLHNSIFQSKLPVLPVGCMQVV